MCWTIRVLFATLIVQTPLGSLSRFLPLLDDGKREVICHALSRG